VKQINQALKLSKDLVETLPYLPKASKLKVRRGLGTSTRSFKDPYAVTNGEVNKKAELYEL